MYKPQSPWTIVMMMMTGATPPTSWRPAPHDDPNVPADTAYGNDNVGAPTVDAPAPTAADSANPVPGDGDDVAMKIWAL